MYSGCCIGGGPNPKKMATVTLDGVRKFFGAREVVHGVSCAVADGELVVVVGPSGCGKSTALSVT